MLTKAMQPAVYRVCRVWLLDYAGDDLTDVDAASFAASTHHGIDVVAILQLILHTLT
jgi:hypothetical protein